MSTHLRSFLFVPANSEKKFAKASSSVADAIILDLEDSIAPDAKQNAREFAASILQDLEPDSERASPKILVRINDLSTTDWKADLEAVVTPALFGIILPKYSGQGDLEKVGECLTSLEGKTGLAPDKIKVIGLCAETALDLLNMSQLGEGNPEGQHRLTGLTWGAEDLRVDLSAKSNRDSNGQWTPPFQLARSLCLLSATASSLLPIDTVYADFKNLEGLERDCRESARDGFTGRLAIHPSQLEIINRCYSPSEAEVEHAGKVVKAFKENPEVGAIAIDGKMYDRPHLKSALRLLGRA